jgi:hypothetical protein
MKYLNALVPNFLQSIDNRLMLEMPHIWRTRIHFIAFYGLIAWIMLFFIGFFYPLSMYDISRTPYAVEEVKRVSFLFLLICGFFSLVYWWQQVAKFRILSAKWYHSFMECGLFFVGIFVLWQGVNAFQNGLDTNMAYRVGRKISTADKEKLYANNFYLPGLFDYNREEGFKRKSNVQFDTTYHDYFSDAEYLFQIYHNRILRNGVVLDSQFLIRKENRYGESRDEGFFYPYHYRDRYVYEGWKRAINKKASKYVKSKWVLEDVWESNDKRKKEWVLTPFRSEDVSVLDSVYQFFSAYDKFQVDSIRNTSVNEEIDEKRKLEEFSLLIIAKSLMKKDIVHVLDTCSNVFFNNQQFTYIDALKSENQKFESKFKETQVFSTFSTKDLALYKNYLTEIMLISPIGNRPSISLLEVGLYYKRDSLTLDFLGKLSKRDKQIYEEFMAFRINNSVKKENAAELVGNLRWNKKTGKYSEIEKYISKDFVDKTFFFADSLISVKKKARFDQIYNLFNSYTLYQINRGMEDWKSNKDTFFVKSYYKKTKEEDILLVDKKMRRDSIPIDTVLKWEIEKTFQYRMSSIEFLFENQNFNIYKKYRDTKITPEDSTFLDNVYTRCGYLRDSSEHSRLFFHANAYYLYLADITINKSRAFLSGWNPFYLSSSNKLAIIVLSFLMFFTTLANSNLFTAVFIAFFINFVNNTVFNLGQNFQEIDKNKQMFWLFGLLAILAAVTAFNVLFRKWKFPLVYLLINIQLFALLGIFVWLFDSQTIQQQSNYGYLAMAFWGLMVWKFRSYLALPSKK